MPAVFVGHGSPMLALDSDGFTAGLEDVGKRISSAYGSPKAILMLSAHWFTAGNLVQKTPDPEQIFDFYGFPEALYNVRYKVSGSAELSDAVLALKDLDVRIDNSWGIDHGAWTPLVHIFPDASVPVVQFSVNGAVTPAECYRIGSVLGALREQGYLLMGSGNIVHNLRAVDWNSAGGSPQAEAFNNFICSAVSGRDDGAAINYSKNGYASYAVPTPEHFLPLLYMLGASRGEKPFIFNNRCTLGAIAMSGFIFG